MNRILMASIVIAAAGMIGGCQTTGADQTNLTASSEVDDATETEAGNPDRVVAVSDPDYDPDKIICKRSKPTGTRIGAVKDCRTAEEWAQSMGNASRAMNVMLNDGSRRAGE